MPRMRLLDFLIVLALSTVVWLYQQRRIKPRWSISKPWRAN